MAAIGPALTRSESRDIGVSGQSWWELVQQAAQSPSFAARPITLVVVDVDDSLKQERHPFNADSLALLRAINDRATPTNALFPVTVCTGRPYPYVEALLNVIAAPVPGICESGCGLVFASHRQTDRLHIAPAARRVPRAQFAEMRHLIDEACSELGAFRLPGKEVLVTLHPAPGMSVEDLRNLVAGRLAASIGAQFTVTSSSAAVDILPIGIDKGTGVEWLVQELPPTWNVTIAGTCYIGDSQVDIPAIERVGYPGSPANAAPVVQRNSWFTSTASFGLGVADVVLHCLKYNLAH